jgi:hypothetical protein
VNKSALLALNMVLLCSLLALPTVLVSAYSEGYENTNYSATDPPVTDGAWTEGEWTYDGEWGDSAVPPNLPETFLWREKWTQPDVILQHFLIEALTDNTTDSGDYFEFCIDLDANGGTAPQANDFRIYYDGDGTLTVYEGDGSGWVEYTDYLVPDDIEIVETMSSSPSNSNQHRVIEFNLNKDKFDISGAGYQPWIRLAVYDASNEEAGVQAWPLDSSADVPDEWGLEIGTIETIPEALTVGIVVLLSSVAVAISFYLLRKRPQLTVMAKN